MSNPPPAPHRGLWTAAAILGATGVIAGAFGAHALKAHLPPDKLASYLTGVRYQLVHAVVLLAVALAAPQLGRRATVGGWLLASGTLLFSGSIYLLVLVGWRWLGPVTPLGGACMIAGWIALAIAGPAPADD